MRILFTIFVLLVSFTAYCQLNIKPEILLSEYVQHESVTGNEKNAAPYLMEKCREAGLNIHVFNDEQNSFNFAASLYPLESGKPNIVFHNHCDVVHPGDSSKWTYPPFSGTIADSAVWGRGAIDNKALAVMQLMALKKFVDKAAKVDLPYNFTILTVSNEEKSGKLGAGRVMNNNFDLLNASVVFGEGGTGTKKVLLSDQERTVYGISIAHKQGVWLKFSLQNEGHAHGAIASDDNINIQMVDALYNLKERKKKLKITYASRLMVKELAKYEKGIIKCVFKHPGLFFPIIKKRIMNDQLLSLIFSNTCNITNINSSDASVNSISDEVYAYIDCRRLEPTVAEDFIEKIRKEIKSPNVKIDLISTSPAAKATVPDKFYKAMKRAVLDVEPDAAVVPILFPAIADNNYFRNKGIPTYGLLPCVLTADDVSTIHNIDEHIDIEDVNTGIDIYTALIDQIINNSSDIKGKKALK